MINGGEGNQVAQFVEQIPLNGGNKELGRYMKEAGEKLADIRNNGGYQMRTKSLLAPLENLDDLGVSSKILRKIIVEEMEKSLDTK